MKNTTFISASAGSGKTHRIVDDIINHLAKGSCRPAGLIATTYTKKAANELRGRLRHGFYMANQLTLAEQLDQGLIGTVHSVCRRLLERFAFEAGISPRLEILSKEQAAAILGEAVEMATDFKTMTGIQAVADRLGQRDSKSFQYHWKTQVRQLIEGLRSNDFDVHSLGAMAEKSVNGLLAFLPEPANPTLEQELLAAFETAIRNIGGNGDQTKGTKDYIRLLQASKARLSRAALPWSDWVKLSKEEPCKPSLNEAQPVIQVASRVENHPRLREDIADYTRRVFSLAGEALSVFQSLKEERGMLDYTDLEQRTFHLLRDSTTVQELIRQELDLLVVDEFQDTSPIQLALFLQLASCAKKTIWVGDVKQAVYGFRSSDPELIQAVVAGVKKAGGTVAPPLSISWRSTGELVCLANALFAPAFKESLGLDESEVRLSPAPGRLSPPQAAVEFFELSSGNFTKDKKNPKLKQLDNKPYAASLAQGVSQLFERGDKCQIVDKKNNQLRKMAFRDVAILCRSNEAAACAASALTERGLPVTRADRGLFSTPEARLALACLRRLADPADTLAAAEIVALSARGEPEQWLESRLAYVKEKAQDTVGSTDRWGLEEPFLHPPLVALERARAHLKIFSPSEALDTAILAADLLAIVSGWGPSAERSAQRRANLEALRALVVKYEQFCATTHVPATISGFLFWGDDLERAQADERAADEQADAIYVGTYHSAKGLEWPVVICSDLDSEAKARLWEVSTVIEDATNAFDCNAPLANRGLRFWAWPFGQQEKGIPLSDRVDSSETGRAALRTAEQEELRLLYVGLTRARDLLVLTWDKARPTPWLDALKASWLSDKNAQVVLPDGTSIPCQRIPVVPPSTVASPTPTPQYLWFPAPAALTEKLPAILTPSGQPAIEGARVGTMVDFGARLSFIGNPQEADLGDALHAILAAELLNPKSVNRTAMATRILLGFGLESAIRPKDALAMADRFQAEIQKHFQPKSLLVEVPFTVTNVDGQELTGIIDLLLETKEGWVVVDHKSFLGKQAAWSAKALSYSGQLAIYASALSNQKGDPIQTWIHFAAAGGLVELLISPH